MTIRRAFSHQWAAIRAHAGARLQESKSPQRTGDRPDFDLVEDRDRRVPPHLRGSSERR